MMSVFGSSLLANTVVLVLAIVLAVVCVGVAAYVVIIKLKSRNKEVTKHSKISDYQFEFKLNTGQFINKLKEQEDDKTEGS